MIDNNFCCQLKLPFEINLDPLRKIRDSYTNTQQYMIFPYNYNDVDPKLISLVDSLDLFISHQEVFYTPAKSKLPIHVDQDRFSNMSKLNWIFGAPGSEMIWWKAKDENNLKHYTTPIGTKYLYFTEDEADEVFRHEITESTFINAGVAHSIDNHTDEGRWCLSHCINLKNTKKNIQMEEVKEIFKNYVL